MTKPKAYKMERKEDLERWFREMIGYLRTENFLEQGTDTEGRKYAIDGFFQLREILLHEQV